MNLPGARFQGRNFGDAKRIATDWLAAWLLTRTAVAQQPSLDSVLCWARQVAQPAVGAAMAAPPTAATTLARSLIECMAEHPRLLADLLRRVGDTLRVGASQEIEARLRRLAGNYFSALRYAADVHSINQCRALLGGNTETPWRRERLMRYARIEATLRRFVRWAERALAQADSGVDPYVGAVFSGSTQSLPSVVALLSVDLLAVPVPLLYRWSEYSAQFTGRVGFFHGTKARGADGQRVRGGSAVDASAAPKRRNGDYRTEAGVARIIAEMRELERRYAALSAVAPATASIAGGGGDHAVQSCSAGASIIGLDRQIRPSTAQSP